MFYTNCIGHSIDKDIYLLGILGHSTSINHTVAHETVFYLAKSVELVPTASLKSAQITNHKGRHCGQGAQLTRALQPATRLETKIGMDVTMVEASLMTWDTVRR